MHGSTDNMYMPETKAALLNEIQKCQMKEIKCSKIRPVYYSPVLYITNNKHLEKYLVNKHPVVVNQMVMSLSSSIIGAGTTHYVRTFTTKQVDQFFTTNVVISDTPARHIFTEDHPQLQCVYGCFLYLSMYS
jgi:hypothetical protein